jgi:hypothetical protein
MNKKNLVYIIIFLLLAGIAAYLIWKEKRSGAVTADQAFAVESPDELEKIIMSDREGRTVTLKKDGKAWRLNDSMNAMPVKVDFLLTTLHTVKMLAPVSEAKAEKVKHDLQSRSIKLQLFTDKNNPADKTYYVGDMLQNRSGNYMAMEANGKMLQPYVVAITGFEGDIAARFLLNPADLRDLGVFDYQLDNIKTVTVKYPYHPYNSFKLTPAKDTAIIEKLPLTAGDTIYAADEKTEAELAKKTGKLSMPRVNDYLNSFKFLNAEAFENSYIKKDSITATRPVAKIVVEDKDGAIDSVTMYLMPANKHTKQMVDQSGNEVKYDADRYFAVFNNGRDFGIVQQYVFGKVLRSRHDFFIYQ